MSETDPQPEDETGVVALLRRAPAAPHPFLDTPMPAALAPKPRPSGEEKETASQTRLLRRLFALEQAYLNPWREARRYLRRCARARGKG